MKALGLKRQTCNARFCPCWGHHDPCVGCKVFSTVCCRECQADPHCSTNLRSAQVEPRLCHECLAAHCQSLTLLKVRCTPLGEGGCCGAPGEPLPCPERPHPRPASAGPPLRPPCHTHCSGIAPAPRSRGGGLRKGTGTRGVVLTVEIPEGVLSPGRACAGLQRHRWGWWCCPGSSLVA